MSDSVSTVLDHPNDSSLSSDDNGAAEPRRARRLPRPSAGNLLDSNGETDDEEIEKLHRTIQDQTKALTEEKQNSLKVIRHPLIIFLLRLLFTKLNSNLIPSIYPAC